MSWLMTVFPFNSSIGRKFVMALTGFGLAGFVMGHMAGNLLIFAGAEAYNGYGHKIVTNPAYPLISWGLMIMAAVHALTAAMLSKQNRDARDGQKYAVTAIAAGKDTTPASRTMMFSGSILLFFLVSHLASFKYGANYPVNYNGVEMRDLHRLIIEKFQSPLYVGGYIVSLVLLGFHLSHGVSSLFQSLGLNHPKYNCWVKCGGYAYAVIVAAGFISQPLYVYFVHKG